MSYENKPNFNKKWASSGDVSQPSDVKQDLGWVAEIPPYQNFNWYWNATDLKTKYIAERGISEWDSATEYPEGARVQHNFQSYVARSDNTNISPVEGGNGTWIQTLASMPVQDGIPVGCPIASPYSVAPDGWIECAGQAFNKSVYKELALAYPSGNLPDLRAQVIKGWDNGRGLDSEPSRSILSEQGDAIRNIKGRISGASNSGGTRLFRSATGAFRTSTPAANFIISSLSQGNAISPEFYASDLLEIDASKTVPTAGENRIRNVAMMYIVRLK